MNKFFKWFSFAVCVAAVPLIVLLAFAGEWLDIITWVFLGIANYLNYKNVHMMEEGYDSRN